MRITLFVNGRKEEWEIDPGEFLADSLRAHGYTCVKTGCSDGACGSCTVFVDGLPILSCEYPTARADGRGVTTIEGVRGEADRVVRYLTELGGEGCGYCAPGYVMMVIALRREIPHPTRDQIREYLNGNLCRCTGYMTRLEAAERYLAEE